ncbi:MAG TPA: MOSC domain-containing protein [Opitutaceae bacterium]
MARVRISHLYVSPAHNYFGHHGKPAGSAPTVACEQVTCVENRGIEGDRFFDYKENYKGQITFFDEAVYQRLCRDLSVSDKTPEVFRRNVIIGGVDLNQLIGKEFTLQGVRFRGMVECKPCYWMDGAFGPGAEEKLKGFGGLRAQILNTGVLKVTDGTELVVHDEVAAE